LCRYEEAIVSYYKALEINPNHYQIWLNRGMVLVNLDRLEEAISSFNLSLETCDDEHESGYIRGFLHDVTNLAN
jgi:tetratricopeptide (TPR) repeat protein